MFIAKADKRSCRLTPAVLKFFFRSYRSMIRQQRQPDICWLFIILKCPSIAEAMSTAWPEGMYRVIVCKQDRCRWERMAIYRISFVLDFNSYTKVQCKRTRLYHMRKFRNIVKAGTFSLPNVGAYEHVTLARIKKSYISLSRWVIIIIIIIINWTIFKVPYAWSWPKSRAPNRSQD